MTLLEHPEDLGTPDQGTPASIWQLTEMRKAFSEFASVSVAGYQCQFPGVDRSKPTRFFFLTFCLLRSLGGQAGPVSTVTEDIVDHFPAGAATNTPNR